MAEPSLDVSWEFSELSRLFLDHGGLHDGLHQVVTLACRTIGGCDMAGVTALWGGEPTTTASTHPTSLELDAVQSATGVGPCLDAWRHQQIVRIDSTPDDERWPSFSEACVLHGILSTVSLPLGVRGQRLGALNLYSRAPTAFSGAEEEVGTLLGRQAAVALVHTHLYLNTYKMVERLREALAARDVIEQAKGILMATSGVSAERASDILRKTSQGARVGLRVIAQQIVDRHDISPSSRPRSRRSLTPA